MIYIHLGVALGGVVLSSFIGLIYYKHLKGLTGFLFTFGLFLLLLAILNAFQLLRESYLEPWRLVAILFGIVMSLAYCISFLLEERQAQKERLEGEI